MSKSLRDISISLKIYIPLIVIVILGLSIMAVNSYLSLEDIEKHAKEDIKKELTSYVSQELNKRYEIALTNVINISLNEKIASALKHQNRKMAYDVLHELTLQFRNYNKSELKIHIHDNQKRSFVRSWNFEAFGDELSSYRESLTQVESLKKPFVVTEVGRAGMAIRAVAPIIANKEYLGSIEVIQDFDEFVAKSKQKKHYSIAVFSCQEQNPAIKSFEQREEFRSSSMMLAQNLSVTDKVFYKTLKEKFNRDEMIQSGLVGMGNYFVAGLKLEDTKYERVGCVLIGADKEYVNRYVEQAKEIFVQQIWMLALVDIGMILLLIYLLQITMRTPILQLLERLRTINKEIRNGCTPLYVYKNHKLPYKDHDEMGFISATINSLLRTMSRTFVELQRSQRDTSEYLKAVYAGGLVSISDTLGNITYVNDKLCKLTGYRQEELLGKPHSIFRDKTTASRVYKKMWETIEAGKIYNGVLKNIAKDGSIFYTNTTIVPITDEQERIVEYIAFRDDITELINSKIELKRTLLTDPLTNLGNRFKMLSEIDEDSYLAIVDIHYFREINDFYGHKIGDIVLQDLAKRLEEFFALKEMTVYHLNGDEFAIVANAKNISQINFFETLKEFLDSNKRKELYIEKDLIITVRLTCGISYGSEHVVSYADIAHKYAKKTNKDIAEYTEQINTDEEYKRNLEWSHELKRAIDENRIQAYFQPIVNAQTSKIEKYETLMRLVKRDGEVVTPIHFLNIAKKTRIYKELTKIMAIQAFEKFSGTPFSFSINLSVEDILSNDIESWFFDLALQKGIAKQLVIEIVESDGIESFAAINQFITKAKEYGMRIAIDDFGTGYSNFEYLIKLNADFLKIDGSLIKEIDKDMKIYSVVETIVNFAKKNNIQVIGEFVATKEIYEKLRLLGIDYGQGFYLGYPSSELQ